jgi:hypothetical protein
MLVSVAAATMTMSTLFQCSRHQVQVAVAHPALADRVVGECQHRLRPAAQHRDLQATVVVEMNVQGCHL